MAGAKKNNFLKANPTQSFTMRFSSKHGRELVDKITELAEADDRSFPGMIERLLVKQLKIKNVKQ